MTVNWNEISSLPLISVIYVTPWACFCQSFVPPHATKRNYCSQQGAIAHQGIHHREIFSVAPLTSSVPQRAIRRRLGPPDTSEATSEGNSSGHCLGQSTLATLPIRTASWSPKALGGRGWRGGVGSASGGAVRRQEYLYLLIAL